MLRLREIVKKLDEFKKELEEIGDYHPDERGDVLNDFVPLLINALEAVLVLHKEVKDDESSASWCDHCADLSDGEHWETIQWPCPTVAAVNKELGE